MSGLPHPAPHPTSRASNPHRRSSSHDQDPRLAAQSATSAPAPFDFEHRSPGPYDVHLAIDFCGICHSDIHQARNEWGGSLYPMVPGHEIVGTVQAVGDSVTKFKVGDLAAIGCMVDSCRTCASCLAGEEQYCTNPMMVGTYNARDKQGNLTYGGYATDIVCDENYVLSVPKGMDPAATAPLLCAGITTYSPLRHWKVGKTSRVGIVGLGGLGHMGLKFAHAFGAYTVLFTTSKSKINDALKLGADEVVLSADPEAMAKHAGSFDFILDCVSAPHDMNAYLAQLKLDGTLCLVGVPEKPFTVHPFSVIMGRKSFAGSGIGGIRETQEMLDFCAKHNILSDIEMTTYDQLDTAWDRVIKGDVKYRFVLDNKSLQQ